MTEDNWETDELILGGIELYFEVRDIHGDQPGRTARLDRMKREGLIKKVWWYEITPLGEALLKKR